MEHKKPLRPNVLVTGTPCVGKTLLAKKLAEKLSLEHINIGDFAVSKNFTDGYDEERKCYILDEDKILDELEDRMVKGGVVVDYHSSDWFPERWFSVVVVPTCSNGVLHDRLAARGYSPEKITENVECEIMQVALDEARTGYAQAELLVHLHETPSDSDEIVEQVTNVYHRQWTRPTVGIQPTTHGD